MKAAVNRTNGDPSVLSYEDAPDPAPGAGDILVEVRAISVEGGDILNRRLVPPSAFPNIVGYQASGCVAAVGADVTGFAVGERVTTFCFSGSHAALRVVPQRLAWRLPDPVSYELGATVAVTFGTAHDAVHQHGRLRSGETVLIQGASGGVGIAAVQLAKATGATVIVTSSSDDNLARLAALGSDHGVNYTRQPIAETVRALTDGKGVDLVLDMVGGESVPELLAGLRRGGRFVSVGASSGSFGNVDLTAVARNALIVTGFVFGMDMASDRGRAVVETCLDLVASGKATMPIYRTYPLSAAAAAHTALESEHPFGRILLLPDA